MNEPTLKRKKRLMDRSIREQKKILIIATLLVVTLFFGSSYALLTNFKKSDEIVNVTTGNMNMSITNNQGLINLIGKLPETDASGLTNATAVPIVLTNVVTGPFTDTTTTKFVNTSPSTMKIKKYEVLLQNDSSQTSTLSDNYVKFAVSTDGGKTYGKPRILNNTDNIIYTGYNLSLNSTKTIYVKTWIDGDADINGVNKSYYGSLSLNLYQSAGTPVLASTKITDKYDGEGGDGLYAVNGTEGQTFGDLYTGAEEETIREYRYSGAEPNNYIYFNGDELWRIVGVFDGELKIVKDTALSNVNLIDNQFTSTENNTTFYLKQSEQTYGSELYWNKKVNETNNNDWTKSGLQYYLNDVNNEKSYYHNLNSSYKELIKTDTTYYLGNVIKDVAFPTKVIYEQERGTTVCEESVISDSHNNNCNIWNGNQSNWNGAIGLLYPSDYGYANSTNLWSYNLNEYLTQNYKYNNWILESDSTSGNYWFLSPNSSSPSDSMYWYYDGKIDNGNVFNTYNGVRPVLNLKSDTKIVDGNGTLNHPYALELD